jgi:hypothetical protein
MGSAQPTATTRAGGRCELAEPQSYAYSPVFRDFFDGPRSIPYNFQTGTERDASELEGI